MKAGQLVILVKRNLIEYGIRIALTLEIGGFPPLGASGEVVCACRDLGMSATHVLFPNHPDNSCPEQGTWWCVPTSWLMPIDDPDAMKTTEDRIERDYAKQRLAEKMNDLKVRLEKNFSLEKE